MRILPRLLLLLLFACDNEPAEASVTNEIPDAKIEKAWFRTTLFTGPIESGQTSPSLRVGVGSEPAYAIVRIGDHAFVVRTNDPVDAPEAVQTRIVFSPTSARSLCFGEPRLAADDEAFIRTRIFPGDEITSDPAACASR